MSKAAELRHVSVSTISRNISRLAEWYGVDLISQIEGQGHLTAAGQSLRDAAQRWINDLQRTTDRISGKRRQHSFRIALPPVLAHTFFPRWWSVAKQQFSDANCVLITGNGPDNRRALENEQTDMLFYYSNPSHEQIFDQQKYEQQLVGQDVLIPCTAPDANMDPLYTLPGTSERPLPWLANSFNTYLGRVLSNTIQNRDDPLYLVNHIESDMVDILRRSAIEGHGVTWIPRTAARQDLLHGYLLEAGSADWFVPIEIYACFSKSKQANEIRRIIDKTASFTRLMRG